MPRTLLIVLAAAVVGFVSVLVYRVSAADLAGPLQLARTTSSEATREMPPVAIEFVVKQCEPGGSLQAAPAELEDRAEEATAMGSSPDAEDTSLPADGPPSPPAPAVRPTYRKGIFIEISPSILFLP